MALQDLSLAGSGDSALPQTPAQQNTQAAAAPQFSLPSAPVNPYIAQQQAAANDMNAAQAQIAAQQAPTYTPPTLSGQPTFFGRILQGALNGLAGGLAQGQANIAGAGTPGFTPVGGGLSYAERLQAAQDQRQAEADKAKQDTAQAQFENDKASYQMKQQQILQQVQSAKNKMAVLDHLQSLEHADQDARDKQQASMDAQLKEAQDAGARVTDIKVQPGQNPKDVFASFLQANPGWMADPNHNATVTYDGDGDITAIHAFVDDSKRRVSVSEVNKRLKAIPGSTFQFDEGDDPEHSHTMTVHDMNSKMASEHTESAQRLYEAKKEQVKADQAMKLAQYNQGQENYRATLKEDGKDSRAAGSGGGDIVATTAEGIADGNGQTLDQLPAKLRPAVQAYLTQHHPNLDQSSVTTTGAMRTKKELAETVTTNLNDISDIYKRRPDLIGSLASIETRLKTATGSNDPDLARLHVALGNYGLASAGIHGQKGVAASNQAANDLSNSFKNGPQAQQAAIDEAKTSADTFKNTPTSRNGSAYIVTPKPTTQGQQLTDPGVIARYFHKYGSAKAATAAAEKDGWDLTGGSK
jgi:hypothetical protein